MSEHPCIYCGLTFDSPAILDAHLCRVTQAAEEWATPPPSPYVCDPIRGIVEAPIDISRDEVASGRSVAEPTEGIHYVALGEGGECFVHKLTWRVGIGCPLCRVEGFGRGPAWEAFLQESVQAARTITASPERIVLGEGYPEFLGSDGCRVRFDDGPTLLCLDEKPGGPMAYLKCSRLDGEARYRLVLERLP